MQRFTLDAEGASPSAVRFYVVLASASGTLPGLLLDGVLVSLNFDSLLTASLSSANGPIWQSTFGVLPPDGQITAALSLPAGTLDPSLEGLTLHHAAMTLTLALGGVAVTGASNPVVLEFVP